MTGAGEPIPRTMRACVLHGPHDLRLEERADARPAPGRGGRPYPVGRGVRVRRALLRARPDRRLRRPAAARPRPRGGRRHRAPVGTASRRPARATGGGRAGIPCRRCEQCRRGRYNLCPDIVFFGTPPVDGALCEYVAVPADFAYRIPDTLSYDAAGLLEPLSVGIWANARRAPRGQRGTDRRGRADRAGVAQVARAVGATEIVVTDISADRLAVGRGTGRHRHPPGRRPARRCGAAAGSTPSSTAPAPPAAIDAGVRAVRPAGNVVLVGMGANELTCPSAYSSSAS